MKISTNFFEVDCGRSVTLLRHNKFSIAETFNCDESVDIKFACKFYNRSSVVNVKMMFFSLLLQIITDFSLFASISLLHSPPNFFAVTKSLFKSGKLCSFRYFSVAERVCHI